MSFDTNKRAVIETSLITAMTTMFLIAALYIPLLSLLIILLPVPLIILATRHGIKYSIFALVVVSFLIGFLTEIVYTFFVLLFFGPMVLLMGYGIKQKYESFHTIAIGAAALIFSAFFSIQILAIIGGVRVIDEIAMILGEIIENQIQILKDMKVQTLEAEDILNYLMMIFPGVIVIQGMVGAFINYYMTMAILKRINAYSYDFVQFSHLRLPSNIVLGSFIIFILTFFTRYIEGISYPTLLANITLIFVFIFFLQGLSIISYLLKKIKIHKAIRISILILIVIISPLLTLVALIGVTDAFFNLRKLKST